MRSHFLRLSPVKLILASVFSALLATSSAQVKKKQEPPPSASVSEIGVFVEHIQLDESTATKLVRAHKGDGERLREQLQELIAAKKAEIIGSAYILARSGQAAKIESVEEFIYPTEHDPAEVPEKVDGVVEDGVDLTIPPNPTAFDVRNLGNTLEVRVDVHKPGGLISLNVVPELVKHVGESAYGTGISTVTQPLFFILKSYTQLFVRSDKYALLGMQTPCLTDLENGKPASDSSRRVFVMVRATVLNIPEK